MQRYMPDVDEQDRMAPMHPVEDGDYYKVEEVEDLIESMKEKWQKERDEQDWPKW
jgi:hypothetical protein